MKVVVILVKEEDRIKVFSVKPRKECDNGIGNGKQGLSKS